MLVVILFAMRMGKALEFSGVFLGDLKRCNNYSSKFKDHKPGHVRSAQELANVFYRNPRLLGNTVNKKIFTGSMKDTLTSLKNKNGMVFIMNGWGSTDHIDLWNGTSMLLRGADSTPNYMAVGKQVWFWELQ